VSYLVVLTKAASRALSKLDHHTEQDIQRRLDELALNPLDPRISKPLKTARGKRSSRAGNWRIIYQIHDDKKIVEIEAVKHRKDADDDL
jgi:mRNA interferase RelE/StbE